MNLQYKKINNARVVPVKTQKVQGKNIKGFDTIENLYANIYICAKKFSGKTNLLFQLLKDCADKNTKIVIICSTVHLDDTYEQIINYFEKKGNEVITFTSIKDCGKDNLDDIMTTIEEDKHTAKLEEDRLKEEEAEAEANEGNNEQPNPNMPFRFIDTEDKRKRKRNKKKKKKNKKKSEMIAQEYIIVLDDLSAECRRKSVASLMKKNRHFKAKVIVSSQHPNDLTPESLKQLQVAMLFGGHSDDKLSKFHRDLDLSIELEQFIDMYRQVTSIPYNFLYIDVSRGKYRKNLDSQISLSGN